MKKHKLNIRYSISNSSDLIDIIKPHYGKIYMCHGDSKYGYMYFKIYHSERINDRYITCYGFYADDVKKRITHTAVNINTVIAGHKIFVIDNDEKI